MNTKHSGMGEPWNGRGISGVIGWVAVAAVLLGVLVIFMGCSSATAPMVHDPSVLMVNKQTDLRDSMFVKFYAQNNNGTPLATFIAAPGDSICRSFAPPIAVLGMVATIRRGDSTNILIYSESNVAEPWFIMTWLTPANPITGGAAEVRVLAVAPC